MDFSMGNGALIYTQKLVFQNFTKSKIVLRKWHYTLFKK